MRTSDPTHPANLGDLENLENLVDPTFGALGRNMKGSSLLNKGFSGGLFAPRTDLNLKTTATKTSQEAFVLSRLG